MRYYFIINPGSHHRKAEKFIPILRRVLDRRQIDYEFGFTTCLDDACQMSRAANIRGFDIIVAVGGDGTINKVINGFYNDDGIRISDARLGVIHTGTSPDFCRSYGIPTQALMALETLLMGKTRNISIAQINMHSAPNDLQSKYYACCASIGVGALVARKSNSGIRKYLGDTLGTLSAILISLASFKASDLKVRCDGQDQTIEANFNTFIGKTAFIASGMKVFHELAPDSSRLYVLGVKKLNLLNIIPVLGALYTGNVNQNNSYLSFSYTSEIEISAGRQNNQIEYDGDPQGFLPCRIRIAPGKLELITNEF